MNTITLEKFYVIESELQYDQYCDILEAILSKKKKTKEDVRNVKLLTLLIETWQNEYYSLSVKDADPVELLAYLLKENNISQTDLANELTISKSVISEVLHYKRGMSKEFIRALALKFKISQDALNKPYTLKI